MRESGPNTQPKCDPSQHHGRIDRRNAQDHPSLSMWPYSSPPRYPQKQQRPQQHPQVSYYPVLGTTQPPYRARATMPMPAQQPDQGMMNFVGQQYPTPNATDAQMMQQPAQQVMPMMAPYYTPNQQP